MLIIVCKCCFMQKVNTSVKLLHAMTYFWPSYISVESPKICYGTQQFYASVNLLHDVTFAHYYQHIVSKNHCYSSYVNHTLMQHQPPIYHIPSSHHAPFHSRIAIFSLVFIKFHMDIRLSPCNIKH